ncbi:MAG TPA: MoxR family ATPase [Bacillota bacterium]
MLQQPTVYNEKIQKVIDNINHVMIGKEEVAIYSLAALLAQGHVLLEDVPGVGKTMLVRALAKSLDCDFKRIQFTPDLLPSDITGVSIYNPKEMTFEFREGPLFGQIVLADEINRTSPKTQAALLEAMAERSVTVDGQTIPLKQPFFVMATQNPIEYEGTYPLPEAQLDRFLLKLKMGYPTIDDEVEILKRTEKGHPIEAIQPVMTKEELIRVQEDVQKNVYVDENIQQYIVNLVATTRTHDDIDLGVSPRGTLALLSVSKAYAYITNRAYVVPDDVKLLAPFVLSHRIILKTEAKYNGQTEEDVIAEIVDHTNVPIRKEFSR